MLEADNVVEVKNLAKTFSLGFFRKQVHAVRGVSFEVRKGEIFGLVGPNGAGKTTTLKMLMGLIQPSSGTATILGEPIHTLASRAHVGYLPEISYYYDYLKPEEILDFYGRLYGLDAAQRAKRVDALLTRVGLDHARGRPLRKFSKGMLQRIGLAQAIIGEPDVVILDEPQSGLDPIGRKEVADLIRELKGQGKTIFFSSHILSDVERICDRVAVLIQGELVDVGPMHALLSPRTIATEIVTGMLEASQRSDLLEQVEELEIMAHGEAETTLVLPGEEGAQGVIERLVGWSLPIHEVHRRREHLEDLFVREAERRESTEEEG